MPILATLPRVSSFPETTLVRLPLVTRHGLRRKWLVCLLVAVLLSPGLVALPPVWHGVLRQFLTWQASRNGYELTVTRISGGIFGATRLEDMRLRQRGTSTALSGTELTGKSATFAVAWHFPWLHRAATSWLREIRLEGVSGRLDLDTAGITLQRFADHAATRWIPAEFLFQTDDLQVVRDGASIRLSQFLISGKRDAVGEIAAHEIRVAGPGYTHTSTGCRGQTFWNDDRLTLLGLDLGEGISLTSATLDAAQLVRRHFEWDCRLTVFGGDVRGQGAVDFARDQVAIEVAATLRHIPVAPLTRALAIHEPVDGQVDDASFTIRGNPENLAASQMWLSARATGFRWGDRRWESLDTQAVVINRRVQLHRFDLRQHGNRLSLAGEFPLPNGDAAALVWTGAASWWQATGFSCQIDARLEDLHALADLVGPGMPDLAGRMSINGQLGTTPQRAEIEGYLNVEGTRLTICGAPLDFLRSTLLFRGGAVEVADVQATHDADYFTAHGLVGLSGEHPDRRGEVRAEVRDMSVYAPALAGLPGIGERADSVRHLDAVLRIENGNLFFDQWDGERIEYLLMR